MVSLEELRSSLESRELPRVTREEIKEYNSQPEVKERGAKLVSASSDKFKNILLILLVVITISMATFAYLAYTDKLKLFDIALPSCPAPAEIPACPAAPACTNTNTCPTVNVICSNVSLSCPSLNNTVIYWKNSS